MESQVLSAEIRPKCSIPVGNQDLGGCAAAARDEQRLGRGWGIISAEPGGFAMASAAISVSTEVPSAWKPVPLKAAVQRTGKVKHQVGAGNPTLQGVTSKWNKICNTLCITPVILRLIWMYFWICLPTFLPVTHCKIHEKLRNRKKKTVRLSLLFYLLVSQGVLKPN